MPSKPKPKRELCAYTLRTVESFLARRERATKSEQAKAVPGGSYDMRLIGARAAYDYALGYVERNLARIERSKRRGRKA